MARKILKYKLTPQGTIPLEIEDGGYYPDGDWLYGASVEDLAEVPVGMVELTDTEFEDMVKGLVMYEDVPTLVDTAKKDKQAKDWIKDKKDKI